MENRCTLEVGSTNPLPSHKNNKIKRKTSQSKINERTFLVVFFYFLFFGKLSAQILGCTDSLASNYNPLATNNDGSCWYEKKTIKPLFSVILNDTIKETSGLVQWDNKLWTHNDDTDNHLYALDTLTGVIAKKYVLQNIINTDTEEITQDNDYFYLGDFGNNYKGNRTDLHIIRIDKQTLLLNQPKMDTIRFHYSNQEIGIPNHSNTTDFDCEAFIVFQNQLYLFTKQWTSNNTSIYVIPNTPGNYTAQLLGTYPIKGLVTGATSIEDLRLIVLCGYSEFLTPFVYLLYDFKDNNFFSGNKRKIELKIPFHQIEGITTRDGLHYYLTNEQFARKPFINCPPKMHEFDLSSFLEPYVKTRKLKKE